MSACIFCSIINRELPADLIFENEYLLAFKDIKPLAKIHVILVPKVCFSYFHNLDEDYFVHLAKAVKEIVKLLDLHTGYRIVNNNGKNAYQTVEHFHLHILGGEMLGHQLDKF